MISKHACVFLIHFKIALSLLLCCTNGSAYWPISWIIDQVNDNPSLMIIQVNDNCPPPGGRSQLQHLFWPGEPVQGDLPQESVKDFNWYFETSFHRDGIVTLPNFLTEEAVSTVVRTPQLDMIRCIIWSHIGILKVDEVEGAKVSAWFTDTKHNVFLDSGDDGFSQEHVRNRWYIGRQINMLLQ